MPKNISEIKLTDDMKKKLRARVAQISGAPEVDVLVARRAAARLQDMNKGSKMSLLDSCLIGPTNLTTILKNSGLFMRNMTAETQSYYAVAMEEMLGLSTKLKYDQEKNQYTAVREAEGSRIYGDAFTFNEEELELGTWDKICAFFGVETEHAKRVSFIKESLKAQEKYVEKANKELVVEKKDAYLEKNADLYKMNKDFMKDVQTIEKEWKNAFFGQAVEKVEDVKDFKFENGASITALSACIAMYKKQFGVNICEKKVEDLTVEEKANMKTVAERYMQIKGLQFENRMQVIGNLSMADLKMGEAISFKGGFEVDYDKNVENLESYPNPKLQNQARALYNYPVLRMKVELYNATAAKDYKPTPEDGKLMKEVVAIKSEIRLYEDIQKENYEKIEKDLGTAYDHPEIDKNASYEELIGIADTFNEARKEELNANIEKQEVKIEENNPELDDPDASFGYY